MLFSLNFFNKSDFDTQKPKHAFDSYGHFQKKSNSPSLPFKLKLCVLKGAKRAVGGIRKKIEQIFKKVGLLEKNTFFRSIYVSRS